MLQEGRPLIFYIHPREIDPEHPKLKMPILRRFMSYYNLKSTEHKVVNVLRDFKFVTLNQLFENF
ncbi:MAG: DUF3473 domain-containing protein [Candidatus Kapaibacteriota bacterium]